MKQNKMRDNTRKMVNKAKSVKIQIDEDGKDPTIYTQLDMAKFRLNNKYKFENIDIYNRKKSLTNLENILTMIKKINHFPTANTKKDQFNHVQSKYL